MNLHKDFAQNLFELKPLDNNLKVKSSVIGKGRVLIGRSESCDVIINHDPISAIHAVIEVLDNKILIYDMNSTNGTYINDVKIVVKEISVGDTVSFADVAFEFKNYDSNHTIPSVLETLEPVKGSASIMLPQIPELPQAAPVINPVALDKSSASLIHPLTSDPRAEFSEYIFENKDDLYPIFKYESAKQSVEVIILFKEKVFSVDYVPVDNGVFFMSGVAENDNEVELPSLPVSQKIPFISIRSGAISLQALPDFKILVLGENKDATNIISLNSQDIVKMSKGDVQVYIRQVQAPPKVAAAPILRRDDEFKKYLFGSLGLVLALFLGLNFFSKKESRQVSFHSDPDSLARILSKK